MALSLEDRLMIHELLALRGTAAIRDAALALGAGNPVGHHVTNIIVTEDEDHVVRARSKGIGVMADRTSGSAVYDDVLRREPAGWRIAYREVTVRRTPLEP